MIFEMICNCADFACMPVFVINELQLDLSSIDVLGTTSFYFYFFLLLMLSTRHTEVLIAFKKNQIFFISTFFFFEIVNLFYFMTF